jgi:predicted nucleic-acid-binding Zn-ribbon protein
MQNEANTSVEPTADAVSVRTVRDSLIAFTVSSARLTRQCLLLSVGRSETCAEIVMVRCVHAHYRPAHMSNTPSNPRRIGRGLKAAVKAFGKTPVHFSVAGKQVSCPHCGHTGFDCREILLNTRTAAFMNLDWLNRGAAALTCKECSRIEWFNETPELIE